jgi:arylsulfatase A-like enzyme
MSLGEHNRTGKSNINDKDDRRWPLYPEIAHIPFLIAAPGLQRGATVDLLAQPADILPTLIELSGLEVENPDPFHGRSFAAGLRGMAQTPIHDVAICGTHLREQDGQIPETAVTPVVYSERWAYAPIGPEGERELYDLDADPYATANVIDAYPEEAEALNNALIDWLLEVGAPNEALDVFARDDDMYI